MKWVMMLILVSLSATAFPFFDNPFDFPQPEPIFKTFYDTIQYQVETKIQPIITTLTIEPRKEILIKEISFEPRILNLTIGEEVTWINQRKKTKSLVIGLREINNMRSPFLNPGDEFIYTFDKAGTFTYSDGVVIGVTGKIVVR